MKYKEIYSFFSYSVIHTCFVQAPMKENKNENVSTACSELRGGEVLKILAILKYLSSRI